MVCPCKVVICVQSNILSIDILLRKILQESLSCIHLKYYCFTYTKQTFSGTVLLQGYIGTLNANKRTVNFVALRFVLNSSANNLFPLIQRNLEKSRRDIYRSACHHRICFGKQILKVFNRVLLHDIIIFFNVCIECTLLPKRRTHRIFAVLMNHVESTDAIAYLPDKVSCYFSTSAFIYGIYLNLPRFSSSALKIRYLLCG